MAAYFPGIAPEPHTVKGKHALSFTAAGIRYLRVSISGLPKDGSWASIKEFRAFGE